MNIKKDKNKIHDCDCDKPEIRKLFRNGNCSEEQVRLCHSKNFFKIPKK